MKYLRIVVMLVILSLTGCQQKEQKLDNSYVLLGNIAVSEDGFYYQNYNEDAIYYYDDETRLNIPLCNKPGCTHKDENCPAYALMHYKNDSRLDSQPMYFRDNLYFMYHDKDLTYYFCKADLDGSNRTLIKEIQTDSNLLFQNIMLNEKYAYISASYAKRDDKVNEENFYYTRLDLDDGTLSDLPFDTNAYYHAIGSYEDNLYFIIFKEDKQKQLAKYNIRNNEVEIVNVYESGMETSFITDGEMYYANQDTGYIMKFNVSSMEFTQLDKFEKNGDSVIINGSKDGILTFIYVENEHELYRSYYDGRERRFLVTDGDVIGRFKGKYIVDRDGVVDVLDLASKESQ